MGLMDLRRRRRLRGHAEDGAAKVKAALAAVNAVHRG